VLLLSQKRCIGRIKKKVIPKMRIISLFIILVTGVFVIPMQIEVQATTVASNPLINNIAQRIAGGNGGDVNLIAQVLQQMATQISDIAGQVNATQTINRISSEVDLNSESSVSVALFQLVLLQADGNIITVNKVIEDIAQQISQGATVPEIIANVVIPAALGMQNSNQIITQIAQNVISGNTDNAGQLLPSSLVICPSKQQYFNQISDECTHFNWNKGNHLQNNFVIPVSADRNTSGQTDKVIQSEKLIQQMILKISIQAGKSSAQKALTQIANQVADNPNGPVSQSIFKWTQKQAAGNLAIVNQAINKVAEEVSQGGDTAKTLELVNIQVEAAETPLINQEINKIKQQVVLTTGGDPTQIERIIREIAGITSLKGGNTQQVIANIAKGVAQPNASVSKSLTSLATQKKQGNHEAVNTAVEKVAEGIVRGKDVKELVKTETLSIARADSKTALDTGTADSKTALDTGTADSKTALDTGTADSKTALDTGDGGDSGGGGGGDSGGGGGGDSGGGGGGDSGGGGDGT
jgi:hypothetical protein